MNDKLFLRTVHLKGFKSIHDVKATLESGLNIFIGRNGSGKSNFLEFLYNSLGRAIINRSVNFKSARLHFLSETQDEITYEFNRRIDRQQTVFEDEDSRISYSNKLVINGNPLPDIINLKNGSTVLANRRQQLLKAGYRITRPLYLKFGLPTTSLECILAPGRVSIPLDGKDLWETPKTLTFLDALFWNIEMSYNDNPDDLLNLDRDKLFSLLSIQEIVLHNLNLYTPISNVRFNENINLYVNDEIAFIENLRLDFLVNGTWLPWSQLSDGTKRLFYLVTEITANGNGIILIEEPELGIHPRQFAEIMQFLKEQSISKQILMSTHHPEALNHLSPTELDNLQIVSYDNKKGTKIKRLTKSQKNKAMAYMEEVGFLSDFWILSDLEP
jgi:AAA15 family ATPase/GTPase